MNPCASIFIIVAVINPFIAAKSIYFDNLFGNSRSKTSSPSTPNQSSMRLDSGRAEELHLNTSENEIDSKIFTSSSEQIDRELESFNSSAGGIGQLNDPDSLLPLSNNVSIELSKNDSQTKTSLASTSTMSSTLVNEKTSSDEHSTILFQTRFSNESLDTATSEETEEVVLGTMRATIVPIPKSIYQRSIEWMESAYTLSILVPVASGVLFATTIIILIALCKCMKRCCRRRRFRQKCLPDSVKNLRPADRARLLGESSDDEF